MKKTRNMTLKDLSNLDSYLLLNQPLLWASRFNKLMKLLLIVGLLNFLVALFLPVGLEHIQNLNSLSIFFCVIGTLSYMWWLLINELFSYRKVGGDTETFYFLKVFTFIYVATIIIISLQIIPFNILEHRIKNAVLDKSLPPLDVKGYRKQISYNKVLLDTSDKYYNKKLSNISDTKASFFSGDRDNEHAFLLIHKRKLSSAEIAEQVLINSGMGIYLYSFNQKNHQIKAYYSTDPKRSKTKGFFLIHYTNYFEKEITSKIYHERIFLREIARFDSLGKSISPMQVYYYRNPLNLYYRYASSDAIHVSLLADRLTINQDNSMNVIEKLDVLDGQLERLDSLSAINKEWPLFAIGSCLLFTLVFFVTAYCSNESLFFSFIATALPLTIVYVFYPKFGRPEYYHPIMLFMLILAMMASAYLIGRSKSKNLKLMTMLLTLGSYSFFLGVLLLLNVMPEIENSCKLTHWNQGQFLKSLVIIGFLFYIVPYFYACVVEKLSYLPVR